MVDDLSKNNNGELSDKDLESVKHEKSFVVGGHRQTAALSRQSKKDPKQWER